LKVIIKKLQRIKARNETKLTNQKCFHYEDRCRLNNLFIDILVALKRADWFVAAGARVASSLAPHPHSQHQLVTHNLAALADNAQRSRILDDGSPLESRDSRVVVVVIVVLVLHPPANRKVVQDGAGIDDSPRTGVVGAQRLEDGVLPLHDAKDVLCAHCPQPREPGVELSLPKVVESLSVAVGLHQHVADRVPRVPRDEELPLALEHALDHGVLPDPGVVVGALPVGDDVEDEVFVVADHLDVDGVAHLPVEEVLGDSPIRNPPRLLLKLHHNTVDTGKEPRQTETRVHPLGRLHHLTVAGQLNDLIFDAAELVGHSLNGIPGSRLRHSTAQPGDTSVMAATIEVQSQANLLHSRERPPTVVVALQVEDAGNPTNAGLVEPVVALENRVRQLLSRIQMMESHRRGPISPLHIVQQRQIIELIVVMIVKHC
jgi:hypothetical protein